MRFADLPDWLRRPLAFLLGATFVYLVFVAGPMAAAELNDEQAWPRVQHGALQALGVVLVVAGIGVTLWCTGLFARIGRGTPVPAEPPRHLVVSGLYRYSRNPIYVAYAAVLLGCFAYFGHLALLGYAILYVVVVQILIVYWEEPVLRKRFGEEYAAYTQRVGRWL